MTKSVITIKSLKHSEFASQETHCFEATVYVDGKRAFIVSNDGHGGCDRYSPLAGSNNHAAVQSLVNTINAELGTEIVGEYKLQNSLDLVIGDLVNDKLMEKELTKVLKRVSYVFEGGLYQLPAKHKPSANMFDVVKKATWWNTANILLNELPKDQAMVAFKTIDGVA